MSTIAVTEARATLPDLLDQVLDGNEVTITRHGQPVAVLVSPAKWRARRSGPIFEAARKLREELDEARANPVQKIEPTMSHEMAEAILKDIRDGRDDV
jgi:prevent-host-death family protein